MRSTEIPKYLRLARRTGIAVLFLGPPGIGKSEIVRQYAEREAKEMNRAFVDFHDLRREGDLITEMIKEPTRYYLFVDFRLTETVPEDLLGIPHKIELNGSVVFDYSPPLWAKLLSLEGIAGMLFLDEITNVQRDDVYAAAYKIILERKVGFLRLSKDVMVVCAGNTSEFSEIARPIPKPLRNRMMVLHVDPPKIDEWYHYMESRYGDKWNRLTYAYLKVMSEDFARPSEDDYDNFPSPRTWTFLALALSDVSDKETLRTIAESLLGRTVGGKFAAFASKPIPEPTELLSNPLLLDKMDNEQRCVALWAVAQYVTRNKVELKLLRPFIEKVMSYGNEMLILFLRLLPSDVRQNVTNFMAKTFSKIVEKIAKYM